MQKLIAHIAVNPMCIFVGGKRSTKYFSFMTTFSNFVTDMNVHVLVHIIESDQVLSVDPARGGKWIVSTPPSSTSKLNPPVIVTLSGAYTSKFNKS